MQVDASQSWEGQVNRLKLIKRQMYGRAKFDLLRQRVLHTGQGQRFAPTTSWEITDEIVLTCATRRAAPN